MICPNCNNQISDGLNFCNQCGAALNPQVQPQVQPQAQPQVQPQVQPQYQVQYVPVAPNVPGKGLGITSMVLGIVSLALFCVWYIAIPCAIVAVILGAIGLNQSKSAGLKNGMAVAGIVCSVIAIAIVIIALAAACSVGSCALNDIDDLDELMDEFQYMY